MRKKNWILAVLLFLMISLHADASAELSVQFLDVGQGLAVLAQNGEQTLLYDGGGRDSSSFVIAYLKQRGITSIDYLVNSHYDEDHLAGLLGCLKVFDVKHVIVSEYEHESELCHSFFDTISEQSIETEYAISGRQYSLGESCFEILSDSGYGTEDNDKSVVIRIVNGNNQFLLTGDAEYECEQNILNSGMEIKSDVLCVGHHGSNDSTSYCFLDAVDPEYAVISCGKYNSYGHPGQDTMNKLQERAINLYRTDEQGSITAVSDGNTIVWNMESCNDYSAGLKENNTVPAADEKNADQSEADYIGNIKSHVFHYTWCGSAAKMKEKNKLYFTGTSQDLIDMGYRSCNNCNP